MRDMHATTVTDANVKLATDDTYVYQVVRHKISKEIR
jgi:hypothetical protein